MRKHCKQQLLPIRKDKQETPMDELLWVLSALASYLDKGLHLLQQVWLSKEDRRR